jgi:hypothetical protein
MSHVQNVLSTDYELNTLWISRCVLITTCWRVKTRGAYVRWQHGLEVNIETEHLHSTLGQVSACIKVGVAVGVAVLKVYHNSADKSALMCV